MDYMGKKIIERNLNILYDYNNGLSSSELANKYNMSKSNIWVVLRKAKKENGIK